MNNLTIINQNGKLVTDSREVAKMIGKGHKNLLRDIKGYMGILESSTLSPQNFFIPSNYKTKGNNKTYDCYLLTKIGCAMVANKMTGKKGILFTAKYVTKFDKMEKTLLRIHARQENAQWQELRKTGKVTRLYETDTIKTFVDYAINQGSQNANRYYTNISKMENKALFLLEQKFPNIRDLLTGQQMLTIGAADQVIEKALRDGMIADLPYKDIYIKAKENIETFATVMGISKVPDDDIHLQFTRRELASKA